MRRVVSGDGSLLAKHWLGATWPTRLAGTSGCDGKLVAGFTRIQMRKLVGSEFLANPATVRGALLTRRVVTLAC